MIPCSRRIELRHESCEVTDCTYCSCCPGRFLSLEPLTLVSRPKFVAMVDAASPTQPNPSRPIPSQGRSLGFSFSRLKTAHWMLILYKYCGR